MSNQWELCNLTKKVSIRLQRGAPIQLPSAAKLIPLLKNCTPPIDLVYFKGKIIAHGDGGNGDDDARRNKSLRALEKVSQGDPIQPCAASPRQGCSRRSLWCSTVVVLFRCRIVLVLLVDRSGRKGRYCLKRATDVAAEGVGASL